MLAPRDEGLAVQGPPGVGVGVAPGVGVAAGVQGVAQVARAGEAASGFFSRRFSARANIAQ